MEIGTKLKEITKEKNMTQGNLVKKVNEADDTLKMTDKKISDLNQRIHTVIGQSSTKIY